MPGPVKWTTVLCTCCGAELKRKATDKARLLRLNPGHLFFCDGSCTGRWRSQQPSAIKMVEVACSWCGCKFELQESVHRHRLRANKGYTYCGPSCSVRGGKAAHNEVIADANATGVMACSECKQVKPLAQFRLRKRGGSRDFPYTRVCLDCTPHARWESVKSPRVDVVSNMEIMLRTRHMSEDDIIDISKCDHTPIKGVNTRAPDWRVLAQDDADEYVWSCCICGFMHKEYKDAEECCEAKGVCAGGRFTPFDKWKPACGRRQEAAGASKDENARA